MASRAVSSFVTFNNGIRCPMIGFGTWRLYDEEAYVAVKKALEVGYRHIDTAFAYENERQIGRAIHEKIKEGLIERKDLFVVSKLSSANHNKSMVVPALQKTLQNLNLDYLDMYLIHAPWSTKPLTEGEVCLRSRTTKDGNDELDSINPVETWRGMEECVELGLAKCIGVSNFNSKQIQDILNTCSVKPVTNQVECHHLLSQVKLQSFLQDNDITLTAYRSLGGTKNVYKFLGNNALVSVAKNYGKTVAQVILRWLLQRGIIVLPKSGNPARIEQNYDVFDFDISDEDMSGIAALNSDTRFCQFVDCKSSKYYPFHEDVKL